MSIYADTSFPVSYYINDSNSAVAQATIRAAAVPLPFTGLHRLEMKNALSLGIFRRFLTRAQASAAWSDVLRDLRNGRLFPQPVNWAPIYRNAAQLAALHTPATGCRSLDVLHIATASMLQAKQFFTFDARQKSLALVIAMKAKP